MSKILVTGGAGYIGSHTVLELVNNNFEVIVIDNFCNSSQTSLERVAKITERDFEIVNCDICSKEQIRDVFKKNKINDVIHFAGLKSVAESINNPILYFENNIYGTSCLLDVMNEFKVNNFIFSSSATVYGIEAPVPYTEDMKLGTASSPYGFTKTAIEHLMKGISIKNSEFKAISLRYFNPIGAHPSGKIGEDPIGVPNNLLPYISQVAAGKRDKLSIFGNDYSTPDGTCRRDYLHVMDLVDGHIAALRYLNDEQTNQYEIFNLGTGKAVSVLEILNKFVEVTDIKIAYEYDEKRPGDLPEFWADASKANKILKWKCRRDLATMIEDTWRWQSNNPDGY